MHAFGTTIRCLFDTGRVRCRVKKELQCCPIMSHKRKSLSKKNHISEECLMYFKRCRNTEESVGVSLSLDKERTLELDKWCSET